MQTAPTNGLWRFRWWLVLAAVLLAPAHVDGHAVVQQSEPAANAGLAAAPAEIRLWLTEPVEPRYSTIRLRDANGAELALPPAQVDAQDPHQLYVEPGPLADGLYTVVWAVVSAADGHRTEGGFPFTIGVAAQSAAAAPAPAEPALPIADLLVRGLNLLALVWATGSIAFVVLVWQPAGLPDTEAITQRLYRVMWLGWWLVGAAGLLLLLLQTTVLTGQSLAEPATWAASGALITGTRFGLLWLARVAFWIAMGGLLAADRGRWVLWAAFGAGVALLATTSVYSHASAVSGERAAVIVDWFHLLMTAIWLGGLVQLLAVLPVLMHAPDPAESRSAAVDRLIGQFSTVARIAVAGLIVTGFYAAWLQVGTLDALFNTRYGQLLLVKLVLLAPLLGLAAFNLSVTHLRLKRGTAVWAGRLRWSIVAESVLVVGILLAVGGMTAINPARNVINQRLQYAAALQAVGPTPAPVTLMQATDELHIMLTVSPGWVGANDFRVEVATMDGQPVKDVSLIRMRFEDQTEDLGQSELRIDPATDPNAVESAVTGAVTDPVVDAGPAQQPGAVYQTQGSNLSAPGSWKVRMTIQRPDQYDAVVDYELDVAALPPTPPPPVVEDPALPWRRSLLLATGAVGVCMGVLFAALGWRRRQLQTGMLALGLALIGGLLWLNAWIV